MTNDTKKRLQPRTIVIIVVVAIALIAVLPAVFGLANKGTTVSKASLQKAVNVSKLSVAEFSYIGIADKLNDRGDVEYHVYYEATADAGMDLSHIDFEIDSANKTVTPILPEMAIQNPVIDESKFDFLPRGKKVDMKAVIELCKQDVANEIANSPNIKATAQKNMRATIEALLLPILQDAGYTIKWNDEQTSPESSKNETDTDTNSAEGDTNEQA